MQRGMASKKKHLSKRGSSERTENRPSKKHRKTAVDDSNSSDDELDLQDEFVLSDGGEEEDVEDVIGGDDRFHFDDGDGEVEDEADGSNDRDTTRSSKGKKRRKDGKSDVDDEDKGDGEDRLTKVDIKEVRYRADEADEGKTSNEVGLESARNRELFRSKFQSIMSRDTKSLEEGGDFLLKLTEGPVKRRLALLEEELMRLNDEKKLRIEKTLFEKQNHMVPHIDTLNKERELKQLSKSGGVSADFFFQCLYRFRFRLLTILTCICDTVVELLNEVMAVKKRQRQKQKEVDENPYAILKVSGHMHNAFMSFCITIHSFIRSLANDPIRDDTTELQLQITLNRNREEYILCIYIQKHILATQPLPTSRQHIIDRQYHCDLRWISVETNSYRIIRIIIGNDLQCLSLVRDCSALNKLRNGLRAQFVELVLYVLIKVMCTSVVMQRLRACRSCSPFDRIDTYSAVLVVSRMQIRIEPISRIFDISSI